jgi:chromosome segregation ATPase
MLKEAKMAMPEERISRLEAKVEEDSRGIEEVRESIRSLDAKVDQRFDSLSTRIDALDQKLDRRFDALSSRMDGLDQKLDRRVDALDQKVDRFREELAGQIHGQIHALDQKISRHFLWLAGFQLTTLLAILGFLSR